MFAAPARRLGHRPCCGRPMRYVLAFSLLIPAAAHAATLLDAFYDSDTDEIIVDIAYRGTQDNHRYVVEWGECRREETPPGVAGRVIDLQGDDAAEADFRVREAFSAAALPCRQAQVTLWLGLRSNASVLVPGP